MKVLSRVIFAAIITTSLHPTTGLAKDSSISISKSWVRYKPAGIKITGAFMDITNKSKTNDALISASSPIATVEIHKTTMLKGIMRMDQIDSITIPKGKTVSLKPGSYHIMLINIKKPLKIGDKVDVKLKFKKAGSIAIKVPVVKK